MCGDTICIGPLSGIGTNKYPKNGRGTFIHHIIGDWCYIHYQQAVGEQGNLEDEFVGECPCI